MNLANIKSDNRCYDQVILKTLVLTRYPKLSCDKPAHFLQN